MCKCSRNWWYSCNSGGSWWRGCGDPVSTTDRSFSMLLSLAVATFTRSHVIAIVLSDAAEGSCWTFIVGGADSMSGSVERIPVRKGCPNSVKAVVFTLAISSGMGRASGLVLPVG